MYGLKKSVRLTLGLEFEIVENLIAHEEAWVTIPEKDLRREESECPIDHCPSLEIHLNNALLRDNIQILVPPDCLPEQIPRVLKSMGNVLPVIIYSITEELLSDIVSRFVFLLFLYVLMFCLSEC